jgi:hypothetical protein
MATIKILHDQVGETLTVYFYEPAENQVCELNDDEMILIRDEESKQLVGFELLHYKPKDSLQPLIIESETFTERS